MSGELYQADDGMRRERQTGICGGANLRDRLDGNYQRAPLRLTSRPAGSQTGTEFVKAGG